MKNIYLKVLIIILISIITLLAFQSKTSALSVEGIMQSASEFFNDGKNSNKELIEQQALQNTINTIYNILFSVCIAAALIIGIMIGIKFMTGSAEDQAKVKETLIPYTVGCSIAFGAFGIWKIVMEIINIVA